VRGKRNRGLEQLRAERADVVFLDIRMPNGDICLRTIHGYLLLWFGRRGSPEAFHFVCMQEEPG